MVTAMVTDTADRVVARDTVQAAVRGAVACITLNRPRVLNCINDAWLQDFNEILDDVTGDSRCRVIVIRGEGRSFCTGIDLTALAEGAIRDRFFRDWEVAMRRLESIEPTVVAAIHGHCIGGGLQLALACDLRIAREDAVFGVTAVKEGIVPGMGMWRIARHAGLGRAKQLALAADVVDAATAHAWGLVDYLATRDRFDAVVEERTERLLAMAWTSTRLTKKLTQLAFDTSWSDCVEVFCEYQRLATESPEHEEAMAERRAHRALRASTRLDNTADQGENESWKH
jgi:enoyl-CoA hydratase/carnithine racemase